MTDLPRGWVWTTVGDVADLADGPFGSNLKTAHYVETGPRVIRLQNIGDGVFRDEHAHITQEHYDQLARHAVRPHDVVVASLGDETPRACLVPGWLGAAIVKADCIRARPLGRIEPGYLMWMLNSPPIRQQAAASIKGVGRPRLGLGGIRRLRLPLPPLAEQRWIVAAIEEQLSRIEAGEQAASAARRRASQLLRRALEWDHRWPMLTVAEVATIVTGSTPSTRTSEFWNGDCPFVTPGDYELGEDVRWARRTLSAAGVAAARVVPVDSVLVTCIGATTGKVGITSVACAINQQINAAISDRERVLPSYLLFACMRSQFQQAVWDAAASTTLPILNKTKFSRLKVPVPSLHEQREAIARYQDAKAAVDVVEGCVSAVVSRAASLRRSVLAAAFRGELVPQDPHDESASMLLERIAAERAAAPKQTRRWKEKTSA